MFKAVYVKSLSTVGFFSVQQNWGENVIKSRKDL